MEQRNSVQRVKRHGKRARRLSFQREYNYSEFEAASVLRAWIRPKPVNKFLMKHNTLCEICGNYNPSDKGSQLLCIYCNVMCHVVCLQRWNSSIKHALKDQQRRAQAKSRHRDADSEWMCFYCIDYLDYSEQQHGIDVQRIMKKGKQVKSQILLARAWRRHRDRRRYLRVYSLIVHIQIAFRIHRQQAAFVSHVRNRLRPMRLRFSQLVDCAAEYIDEKHDKGKSRSIKENFVYLMVSVLGTSGKNGVAQTWRMTTDLIAIEKPSIVQQQMLHERSRAEQLGPWSGAVHESANRGKRRRSVLLDTADDTPRIWFDSRIMIGGISGNQIIVISVFQKGLLKDTFLGQVHLDLSNDQQNPLVWRRGGSFKLQLKAPEFPIKDSVGTEMRIDPRLGPKVRGYLCFDICPMASSMSAECGYVYGPCVEDLVRAVQRLQGFPGLIIPKTITGATAARTSIAGTASNLSNSYGFALPMKRIWLAIADGTFYLYSHFGDALKLIVNVEYFQFSTGVRNKIIYYKLHFQGFPDLIFHNAAAEETLRWKCAFLSCRRYDRVGRDPQKSSYDMDALINDIIILDMERTKLGAIPKKSSTMKSTHKNLSGAHDSTTRNAVPGFRLEHMHEALHQTSLEKQKLLQKSPMEELFQKLDIDGMMANHRAEHEKLRKELGICPKPTSPMKNEHNVIANEMRNTYATGDISGITSMPHTLCNNSAAAVVIRRGGFESDVEKSEHHNGDVRHGKAINSNDVYSTEPNDGNKSDSTAYPSSRSPRYEHEESASKDNMKARMRRLRTRLSLITKKTSEDKLQQQERMLMEKIQQRESEQDALNAQRMKRIEMIKSKLKEEYDIEESSMNNKFVKHGRDFVTTVLAEHAARVIAKEAAEHKNLDYYLPPSDS